MSMCVSLIKLRAGSTEQGAIRLPASVGHRESTPCSRFPTPCFSRHGLSLIEVVASTLIVGMMSVAALNSLGSATRSAESIGNRAVALGLADDLMTEILQQPYSDLDTTPIMGLELVESTGTRYAFDDVDDYNGWSEQPPQPKKWRGAYNNTTSYAIGDIVSYQGATYVSLAASIGKVPTDTDYWQAMPQIGDHRGDFKRTVTVTWVLASDPTTISGTDQGAKRIRVTVVYRDQAQPLAELIAIRTNSDSQ